MQQNAKYQTSKNETMLKSEWTAGIQKMCNVWFSSEFGQHLALSNAIGKSYAINRTRPNAIVSSVNDRSVIEHLRPNGSNQFKYQTSSELGRSLYFNNITDMQCLKSKLVLISATQ